MAASDLLGLQFQGTSSLYTARSQGTCPSCGETIYAGETKVTYDPRSNLIQHADHAEGDPSQGRLFNPGPMRKYGHAEESSEEPAGENPRQGSLAALASSPDSGTNMGTHLGHADRMLDEYRRRPHA